jgi:hypothetical protein
VLLSLGCLVRTPTTEIEKIDVLVGADAGVFGVNAGLGGAINFLTKTGNPSYDLTNDDINDGVVCMKVLGFISPKAFYHPKDDKPQAITRPDYRATLYWNPSIKTDINGKASLSFWSSDNKGGININLEGNTAKGQIGLGQMSIEVR